MNSLILATPSERLLYWHWFGKQNDTSYLTSLFYCIDELTGHKIDNEINIVNFKIGMTMILSSTRPQHWQVVYQKGRRCLDATWVLKFDWYLRANPQTLQMYKPSWVRSINSLILATRSETLWKAINISNRNMMNKLKTTKTIPSLFYCCITKLGQKMVEILATI